MGEMDDGRRQRWTMEEWDTPSALPTGPSVAVRLSAIPGVDWTKRDGMAWDWTGIGIPQRIARGKL